MYRSLHAVRYTENTLCQNIAVGEATIKGKICKCVQILYRNIIAILSIANHDSLTRNTLIKHDPLVEKLWTGGQQQINDEQKKSVKIAVENKFQLIQGPPGNNYYMHTRVIRVTAI